MMVFEVTRGGIFSWRKMTFIADAFFDKKVDRLVTKAFKNHIKSYKIIEIHAFLSFCGTIVVHPYFARGPALVPTLPIYKKLRSLQLLTTTILYN